MGIWEKFTKQEPMKYYDAAAKLTSSAAQAMINNENNNYIATQKSDGEWCRLIISEDGQMIAQSRNISKVTGEYGDKTSLIPHIMNEYSQFPRGTVLLGELCFDDITSTARDVGTILRCLPAKAIARQTKNKLFFKAFDCLAYNGIDLMDKTYDMRFGQLIEAIIKVPQVQYITVCNYVLHDFPAFLADILNAGGEGIVIHSRNYLYAPGKRPAWTTLKVKKTTGEIEVPVIDTLEPNKYYEGTEEDTWEYKVGGQLVTKRYYFGWKNGVIIEHNGNRVNVTSGVTDADAEWLSTSDAAAKIANGDLVAVISGMEVTEDSIRHPRLIRLRTDT